ncbi:TrmB family transcriptional regulator [Halomontanus rarus]|uniref:TrmB family transcriptional regulator n=1 Tax=Halomontanus rarus TaxID=3034020 RepID=UPI00293BF8BB|nr:TrmB family transcriptional regulator sugar-binding domain-containing protein [Halovivax sp. KZCA124]
MVNPDDVNEADTRALLQQNANLSKYESQVYLALVKEGKQTMKELADESGVPKQRVYDVIETLRNRSFVELDESYPKQAYAIEPSKVLDPVQERIEAVEGYLEELHQSITDVDGGVAQFRSRSTISKYVSEMLTGAERTVYLMTSLRRFNDVEEALREVDAQIRLVITDLDASDITGESVSLPNHVTDVADYVRGTARREPFVLVTDRQSGFFWPTTSGRSRQAHSGFYITDQELAFLLDRFLADTVWPLCLSAESDGEKTPSLPQSYYRIRNCLDDLDKITENTPIEALTVTVEGIDTITEEGIRRHGRLRGFYHSRFDDRAFLEVEVVEPGDHEPRIVTVGDWDSQEEDYRAEVIELRRKEERGAELLDKETREHVKACREQFPDAPLDASVLVGFDGYIDSRRSLVEERKSPRMHEEIETISSLRETIGKPTTNGGTIQFEWLETERGPGGHTAHLGQSLQKLGGSPELVGYFGQPICEEFSDTFKEDALLSLDQPTVTEFLEFEDGKIMFTDAGSNRTLDWELLLESVPLEDLVELIDDTALVSTGGWPLIPGVSEIWEGLRNEIYPRLSSPPNDIFACTDNLNRIKETRLRSDLESLRSLDERVPVTLVTNEMSSKRLQELYLDSKGEQRSLSRIAYLLQGELGITRLVITTEDESVLAVDREVHRMQSVPLVDPAEGGVVEDHLAAGLALGRIKGLDDGATLALGVFLGGYYKRHRTPPTIDELRSFLDEFVPEESA